MTREPIYLINYFRDWFHGELKFVDIFRKVVNEFEKYFIKF